MTTQTFRCAHGNAIGFSHQCRQSGTLCAGAFCACIVLIREDNAATALANAAQLAATHGAISSYLYSADPEYKDIAQHAFAEAGASLWCNMTVPMPINFAAAYSDYHVTGLNPAGNACLADLAFVTNRFRIVQFREPA